MQDLITVIIPVYNVEKYLDRCIQSVLSQTYKNLEIILINDKSTDRSNEICLSYMNDKRIIVVQHSENKGLSGARNSGLNMAHGEYAVFIDSDDYVQCNMIENMYKCMIETGADTVIAGFRRVTGNKIKICENRFAGEIYTDSKDIKNKVLKKMLGPDGVDHIEMSVWKVLFSMSIIKENHLRFPDKKYLCEDIIFDFDYYPLSKRIVMSDDTGYCYCLNRESLSQVYQINKFDRIQFQTEEIKKRIKTIGLDENAYIRLDNFYVGNLIHHMKTMAATSKTIGRKKCIEEYRRICNNSKMNEIKWKQIDCCYKGRDRIAYSLVRRKKIKSLYVYLRILTKMRKILRNN